MILLKALSTGVSYNFFAVSATRGMAVLVAVIIARTFGTESFGLYSFLMAITTIALPVADFGVSISLQKYLSNFGRDKVPSVIGCAFAGKFCISLVISLLLLILDSLFGLLRGYGPYVALIILLSSFNLVVMSLNAELKFKHSAVVQILIEASFAAIVIVAVLRSWQVTHILVFRGLSYLIIGLPVLLFFVKPKWMSIVQEVKIFYQIMRFGFLSTILAFLSVLFNQAGLIILGFIKDYESTGILKAAMSISTLVLVVPEIIRKPLLPIISNVANIEKDTNELMKIHCKVSRIVTAVLLPVLVLGIIFAKQIIIIVFGQSYGGAVLPFRILLVVNFLAAITVSYFSIFYMDGGIKTLIHIGTACASISIVGNFLLVPTFGPAGSALAALLAQVVGTVWIICAFKNKYITGSSHNKIEMI